MLTFMIDRKDMITKQQVIQVEGLSVSYDRKRVLTNIFLHIDRGHVYGVIGPNGAGKSTLFKSILGLIKYESGKITVLGKQIEDIRKHIAYVPQKDEVDWTFPATVEDIVLQGRYPHLGFLQRMSTKDKEIGYEAMDQIGILDLKDRQIGQLSGGQQQRVFIARALCQKPEIFLLDEPFVGVDMVTEEKIISLLKRLASEGKTLLVVHHDLSTVKAYFDQVILLNQRLISYGPTAMTFTDPLVATTFGAQLTMLHQSGFVN